MGMKNEQIMIVEDDNELNRGLCTAFRSEGRNVICVSTISEAREQLLLNQEQIEDLRTNE